MDNKYRNFIYLSFLIYSREIMRLKKILNKHAQTGFMHFLQRSCIHHVFTKCHPTAICQMKKFMAMIKILDFFIKEEYHDKNVF